MQRTALRENSPARDASRLKVGIVLAEYNPDITESLLTGALTTLHDSKVTPKNIKIARVYGSFDLTYAADRLLRQHKLHAVIALGSIIKGETDHDKYIASAVTQGLTDLTIKHGVPISLGVLTTNTLVQARARSRGDANHGKKAALAALQSAFL